MPVLGGCQILTLEAPLIAEKAPCMYNSYILVYGKDDVRSPFVKPPCLVATNVPAPTAETLTALVSLLLQ
jgi:hypothetical protein